MDQPRRALHQDPCVRIGFLASAVGIGRGREDGGGRGEPAGKEAEEEESRRLTFFLEREEGGVSVSGL